MHQEANKSAIVSIKTVWCRLIASRGSDCNSEEKMELSTQISVWHRSGLLFCCQKIPQIKSYFIRQSLLFDSLYRKKCDSGKCVRIKDLYWNLIGELREARERRTEAAVFVSAHHSSMQLRRVSVPWRCSSDWWVTKLAGTCHLRLRSCV